MSGRQSEITESTQPQRKVDSEYVKQTVKDIVLKSQRKVKVDQKAFDEILKIDK